MIAKVKSKLNLEERAALQEVIPLDTPYLLYVDPSSACNFRCRFCPSGHTDLVQGAGYRRSIMRYDVFKKLISGLSAFPYPLKVMRFNKIGEPLLNRHLADMIALAKNSGRVSYIDLATNGSLLLPDMLARLVSAGLDRINISLEGLNDKQYRQHANINIDFQKLTDNIKHFYSVKGGCEVTIKIPANILTEGQRQLFFDTFGNYCDRIFIEDIAPIWPEFDIVQRSGLSIQTDRSQYKLKLKDKLVCTYIFYALAVNADGTVSACCPDWKQKLLIGDLNKESIADVWKSKQLNALRRVHLKGNRSSNPVCSDCGHVKYAQVDDIDAFREDILKHFS